MLSSINQVPCCHASPFVATFYALLVLSRHEHDRIGFNGQAVPSLTKIPLSKHSRVLLSQLVEVERKTPSAWNNFRAKQPDGEFFFASSDLESRLSIFVFLSGVKIVEACQSMLHVIAMIHYRIKVKKLKSLGCTLYIRLQAPALLRVSLFFVYFFRL